LASNDNPNNNTEGGGEAASFPNSLGLTSSARSLGVNSSFSVELNVSGGIPDPGVNVPPWVRSCTSLEYYASEYVSKDRRFKELYFLTTITLYV